MMDLKIEFTNKEITPWGGMVLMKELIKRTGINEFLQKCPLPKQNSNRGYDPIQLINNFWVSIELLSIVVFKIFWPYPLFSISMPPVSLLVSHHQQIWFRLSTWG